MKILLIIPSIVFTFFLSSAQSIVGLKTKSVSIYNNQSAYFIREGIIKTDKEGKYFLRNQEIPSASFGTFWIFSSSHAIDEIKSYVDTAFSSKNFTINNFVELIKENLGKKVYITLDEGVIEGVIKGVAYDQDIPKLVHLENSEQGWVSLKPELVKMVRFDTQPKIKKNKLNTQTNTLEIKFKDENQNVNLNIQYLKKSIHWSPIYYLEIYDKQQAELTLRAEAINNAESFSNAELNFVVGQPQFKYIDKMSGLTQFEHNQSAYAQINPRYNGNSEKMMSLTALQNPIEVEEVEEHQFFSIKNASMNKESSAHFELFTTKLAYKDFYECRFNNYEHYGSGNKNGSHKVFHNISFINNSKQTLPSGAVLLIRNDHGQQRPIAQVPLQQTSIGGVGSLMLSEVHDIKIDKTEFILSKNQESSKIYNGKEYQGSLTKIISRGNIKVKSYKDTEIKMKIYGKVLGKLIQSEESNWKIVNQKSQDILKGDINDVVWEFKLKPYDEYIITYDYESYKK